MLLTRGKHAPRRAPSPTAAVRAPAVPPPPPSPAPVLAGAQVDTVKKQIQGNTAARGPIKSAGAGLAGWAGWLRGRGRGAVPPPPPAPLQPPRPASPSASAPAPAPAPPTVKLENDTETFEHERVSSELKKQIQQARLAKKLTQVRVCVWRGRKRRGKCRAVSAAAEATAGCTCCKCRAVSAAAEATAGCTWCCGGHSQGTAGGATAAPHARAGRAPIRVCRHSSRAPRPSHSLQAQLAQMINEKPQTINEYEAGKAIPNPQVRCGGGLVRCDGGLVAGDGWACGGLVCGRAAGCQQAQPSAASTDRQSSVTAAAAARMVRALPRSRRAAQPPLPRWRRSLG